MSLLARGFLFPGPLQEEAFGKGILRPLASISHILRAEQNDVLITADGSLIRVFSEAFPLLKTPTGTGVFICPCSSAQTMYTEIVTYR